MACCILICVACVCTISFVLVTTGICIIYYIMCMYILHFLIYIMHKIYILCMLIYLMKYICFLPWSLRLKPPEAYYVLAGWGKTPEGPILFLKPLLLSNILVLLATLYYPKAWITKLYHSCSLTYVAFLYLSSAFLLLVSVHMWRMKDFGRLRSYFTLVVYQPFCGRESFD